MDRPLAAPPTAPPTPIRVAHGAPSPFRRGPRDAPIRLLVVDDHPLVRLGLVKVFATARNVEVVGQASDVAEALAAVRACRPDVVVMDVRLPDGSGIDACRAIRAASPTTRVVILTSFADDNAVVTAIGAGASAYLLKQSKPDWLIAAVETAGEGGSLVDPAVGEAALRGLRGAPPMPVAEPLAGLSEQERHVLPLIAEGHTNRQIAAALSLSEHTVKAHVSNILRKLRLSRRVEAASLVARQTATRPPAPAPQPRPTMQAPGRQR